MLCDEQEPTGGFKYGGVIVSNCDLHIDTYKPADMPTAYGANNHGSMVQIEMTGIFSITDIQWYVVQQTGMRRAPDIW